MAAGAVSWIGQVLAGRYRVTARLGEGGMAFVYRARDLRLDADVVVKAPRPAMLEDPQFADRFGREVRALVRLAHPNVVRVSDVGDHAGVPFAVMDFLAGGSLQDRRLGLDGAPAARPPEVLRGWLADVAGALDFIHASRHVHRDVKPDNILFDAHGRAYLSDFGIVKALEGSGVKSRQTVLTAAGLVLGTPQYMAPELVLGERYDGRADQYALAVTVYELLAGRPPFGGETPVAVLMARVSGPAPSLQETLPTVPKALAAAVQKALAKDPRDRHADCAAFAWSVLQAVGAGPPLIARPALPVHETAHPQRPDAALPVRIARPALPVHEIAFPVATPAVTCPACSRLFGLPTKMWGKKVKCPDCRKMVVAGTPGTADPPAREAETGLFDQSRVETTKASEARPRRRNLLILGGVGAAVLAVALAVACVLTLYLSWPKQITNSLGMKLVLIPAGTFMMGAPDGEAGREDNEGPPHPVAVARPFYMGVCPVTQEEYERLTGKTPSYFRKGGDGDGAVTGLDTQRFPVESVSWDDAVAFCAALNRRDATKPAGWAYGLPTEAEWEYACRAGTKTAYSFGDDPGRLGDYAWYDGNAQGRTHEVGGKKPNAWGLDDMHGNVCEWCIDRAPPYNAGQTKDPGTSGPADNFRPWRGGSWSYAPRQCRSASRFRAEAGTPSDYVGFRIVLRQE